jgi:hypothetical protein
MKNEYESEPIRHRRTTRDPGNANDRCVILFGMAKAFVWSWGPEGRVATRNIPSGQCIVVYVAIYRYISLYIAIYRRAPFQYIGCGTRPLREPWSALDSLGHSRLGTCIPIHRPVFAYVLQLLIIRRSSVDRTGPVHRCFIPSYHQCRRHAGLDGGRDADGVREAAQVYRQGDQVAGGR